MPILPAEPDIYPANLWPDLTEGGEGSSRRKWWCLHTKPRQEKATARDLRAIRVPYYLPQVLHEAHTPQGRKTRSVIPLFTSYLFLFGDEAERVASLKGNRLVRVIEVVDQNALNQDLYQIHRLLASGLAVLPELTVPVGARVRILNGPLTGMVGRVIRRGKRDHFVALVNFLGSGAVVDLADWQVEQLPELEEEPAEPFNTQASRRMP